MFYPARLVRLERFVLKETRIELPPTWRFYPARLVRLERFVLKETTHTAVPHVDSLSGATWVVTISGNYSSVFCPKKPVWLGTNCRCNDAICVPRSGTPTSFIAPQLSSKVVAESSVKIGLQESAAITTFQAQSPQLIYRTNAKFPPRPSLHPSSPQIPRYSRARFPSLQ